MSASVKAVARVVVRQDPGFDWDFARARADAIDAHWRALIAARPRLFDGQVLLMRDARFAGDALEARAFVTRFRNFQAWKDFGFVDPAVVNIFAMAALRSGDGAWMMGRMGPHTANAGQVYFPAGTPDLDDLKEGVVDLDASAWRELGEETGLGPADCAARPGWIVVRDGPTIACMKVMDCSAPATTLVARVASFLGRESRPELDGLFAIRGSNDADAATAPGFIRAFLAANVDFQPG